MEKPGKKSAAAAIRFNIFYLRLSSKAMFRNQPSPAVPAGGFAIVDQQSLNLATHELGCN
jgi:hypothetical protein